MALDPVSFLPPLQGASPAPGALESGAGDFATWLAQAASRVNGELQRADHGLQQLASGEAENLHQVMIVLEEARLGLQLMVQVRNRLLEAYQEVLRMPL